jgi:tetratricopeptide (TPR) repeat protein
VAAYERAVILDSSFVEAWAQLARTRAVLYYLSAPSPAAAEAARQAAARALALAPGRPEGHRAMSAYYANVLGDVGRAFAEDSSALALTPINADLLVAVARKEMALSRWPRAIEHLEQATRLDPRSVLVATRLGFALFWLRRYAEALQAYDRAIALSPANLPSYYQQASVHLARGDISSARKVLALTMQELDTAKVVAQFADGLSWILNEDERALAWSLTPRFFDNDRGTWGVVLAEAHWLADDRPRAHAYADSAMMMLLDQAREAPNDPAACSRMAVALAYLGRKAAAMREGKRCEALLSTLGDAIEATQIRYQLVQLYVLLDEPEKALDYLEPLLDGPSWLSPSRLRIDPSFGPLRGNPRFEQLVNRT